MSRYSFLSDLLSTVFNRHDAETDFSEEGSFKELCEALLSERGEQSGQRLARGLLKRYRQASQDEKRTFFSHLLNELDLNPDAAIRCAESYASDRNANTLSELINAVEPKRQELFRRLNRVPGATAELVRMRADLLDMQRAVPDLRRIDVDFQHLLKSWFNQGFLVLREIDWHTPANILEKIIAYEAVHAINSWSALRSRLEPSDRRCFAFFHPSMLDEPLMFVEVALTQSDPSTVREVLIPSRPVLDAFETDTAVFYSISNCQKGLAGVSFGDFLIKQVARELSEQLPNLSTFRTLSPVPGFMNWVRSMSEKGTERGSLEEPKEAIDVQIHEALRIAMRVGSSEEADFSEEEGRQLQCLVAHYLVNEKRPSGEPLDPVARFHLRNGASLDRVLPGADVFRQGLLQSASVMVSYLYDLERVDSNHEIYARELEVFTSDDVRALLIRDRRARKRA